jgi:hypothetical protein
MERSAQADHGRNGYAQAQGKEDNNSDNCGPGIHSNLD